VTITLQNSLGKDFVVDFNDIYTWRTSFHWNEIEKQVRVSGRKIQQGLEDSTLVVKHQSFTKLYIQSKLIFQFQGLLCLAQALSIASTCGVSQNSDRLLLLINLPNSRLCRIIVIGIIMNKAVTTTQKHQRRAPPLTQQSSRSKRLRHSSRSLSLSLSLSLRSNRCCHCYHPFPQPSHQ
jgi:hypothetical protein